MEISGVESSELGVLLIDAQPAFWDWAFPDDEARKEPVIVRLEHLLMLLQVFPKQAIYYAGIQV